MTELQIKKEAERNDEGELIYKQPTDFGEKEVNVTHLLTPGKRKSSNQQLLIIEARLLDSGEDVDNPAFPTDEKTADAVLEKLDEEGIEPAWLQGPSGWKP